MMLGKQALCAALCLALSSTAYVVEEVNVPLGWKVAQTPASNEKMRLQVGLARQNVDKMISYLHRVSDPGSSCYGQHLEHHEANDMVKPKKSAEDKVIAWLKSGGAEDITSDGHWVKFVTTVGQADSLLNTKFLDYEKEGRVQRRTTEYSVPDALANDIDLIIPTTYFSSPKGEALMAPKPLVQHTPGSTDAAVPCSTALSPQCVHQLYNINYNATATSGAKVGFGSFLMQRAQFKDFALYLKSFGLPKQTFTVVSTNGATDNQSAAYSINSIVEANLDSQNIVGVAHGLPLTEFITKGLAPFRPNAEEGKGKLFPDENEPYVPYYEYLLSQSNDDLPNVISNSYGDDEQTVPYAYQQRVCQMIAQMGTRGITILESSGDVGVGDVCKTNNRKGPQRPVFGPTFPGTCPYVLAVGGTQNYPTEAAWNTSSGGFSFSFNRPLYQNTAVRNYLGKHISPKTLAYYQPYINMKGRAFPDVSAHSDFPPYITYLHGQGYGVAGTSASSPVWGGIIGLLNDARLKAGMSTMGFINPFLYANQNTSFTDITTGGSIGCTGENLQLGQNITGAGIIPYASWNATTGWDPVTGLGTPNFAELMTAALASTSSKTKRSECSA